LEEHFTSLQINVWIPAFAGMTTFSRLSLTVIPAALLSGNPGFSKETLDPRQRPSGMTRNYL
jgi:hypothetical protein